MQSPVGATVMKYEKPKFYASNNKMGGKVVFNIVGRSHFLPTKRPSYAAISPIGSLARRLAAAPIGVWHWIGSAVRNIASRRELQEMDDRMLKDLGISRAQAEFLASRPVWKRKAGTTDRI